jgi:hypothetical protein
MVRIIEPAMDLLPAKMGSEGATIMLLAIGLQESGLALRQQIHGPARGLWQFEQGGGVHGILTHPATTALARKLCATRGCPATERSAYLALAGDDILAAGFARLLLWTDPEPLPDNESDGWDCYLRTWRPGKPRPAHWIGNYRLARVAVTQGDDGD